MAIISKETFDKFTEEEKEKLRQQYSHLLKVSEDDEDWNVRMCASSEKQSLINVFGKENLQPEPEIKTWKDIEEYYTNVDIELGEATKSLYKYSQCPIQLLRKCIATLKITKLIELGYGGIVTDEEWENKDITKYCVQYTYRKGFTYYNSSSVKAFLAFHTFEQREKFMSYPENRELVEQYYMM